MTVEVVKVSSSQRANLSANYLNEVTDWPVQLRSDYIAIGGNEQALFNNDLILEIGVNQNADDIARANSLISAVDLKASQNSSKINKVNADVQRAVSLSVSW